MRVMDRRSGKEPQRFYSELARWWPLISPVEEYENEAGEFVRVIGSALASAQSVLELGSGGGHNAFHMKRRFQLTLSDRSAEMLAVSRALNPECEHVLGDMRSLRLGRTFDAVFVQDAVDYMYPESELAAVIATAYAHCRPGGVALFVPDEVQETFAPDTSCGGSDGPDGAGARYLAWSYDPDPNDGCTITEYAFVLREPDGTMVRCAEQHVYGLYSCETWLSLLAAQGFVPEICIEQTDEPRTPRRMFLARKP